MAHATKTVFRWAKARAALDGTLAAAIGIAAVAYVFGTHILDPSHTGWMLSGTLGPDPVQYWLGYTFFTQDSWRWPPGLNPRWGIEIGSGIFYADSIPLLAFAFKALAPLVSVPQYWGLWLFACGALQAFLGWRLLGLATEDRLARLAGCALFVLCPTWLNRAGGHFALAGQFLVLLGLLLCLARGAPGVRRVQWAGLMLVAAMVQSYLLPMVGGLWAADWLARAWRGEGTRAGRVAELALAPGAGIAGLWLAGFFTLRGGFGGTWGAYGAMQLDLLAPFDPSPWGRFLPDLPGLDHLEVGHAYAGLGVLLVLALAALAYARRPLPGLAARWPLLLALSGMLAFAVSHRVAIGGHEVLVLPLPAAIVEAAGALRASERFVWPAAYALLVGAVAALAHGIGPGRAGLVLLVAAGVQFADLQPGLARLARYFPPTAAEVPLRLADPFWTEAARRYTRIRLHPTGLQARFWEEIAVFAATRGLTTDAVYLARVDPARVQALNELVAARLATGAFEPRTLYALGSPDLLDVVLPRIDPARDLVGEFDGIWVVAPGWWAGPPPRGG